MPVPPQVVLHPRWAPSGLVRVWVGVRGPTQVPQLRWTLNGLPAQPQKIRSIDSPRTAPPLTGANPRVFTGVYEFSGVPGDTACKVGVVVSAATRTASHEISIRPFPSELPGAEGWFHILLVSCYHAATSPGSIIAQVMRDIAKICRPSLSLLMGDQVYLDLPTIKDFPEDANDLAAQFEHDYVRNWFEEDGYRDVLAAAPSVSMPDDHEYWNNFPHTSPFIQNTWGPQGRADWQLAARALFDAFQAPDPATVGDGVIIDIPPVSIFISDTRTWRQADASATMSPQGLTNLKKWLTRLNADGHTGIFISGQSMLDPAAGVIGGTVGDKSLSNYGDFPEIMESLSQLKKPFILITGDVHWGRVVQVRDLWHDNRVCAYEIITSPASLVETVGSDQWKSVKGWLGGLIGPTNPWPRHSPPHEIAQWQGLPASRFETTVRHGQTGNQVAVLGLRRFGDGVQARIGYFSLHTDREYRTICWSDPFDLSSGISRAF